MIVELGCPGLGLRGGWVATAGHLGPDWISNGDGMALQPVRTHATSKLYRTGIPFCEVPHNAVARGGARTVLDAARTVAGDFAECAACHPEEC